MAIAQCLAASSRERGVGLRRVDACAQHVPQVSLERVTAGERVIAGESYRRYRVLGSDSLEQTAFLVGGRTTQVCLGRN